MLSLRSNWVLVSGMAFGMAAGVAQAQQTPVLSASAPAAEPMISAPEPVAASTPQPLLSPSRSSIQMVPPAAGEPGVADRQFWILVGATAGAAVLDGETTIRGLQNPGRQEINPLLGTHPDRARFYTTVGVVDAGVAYLAYRLKRSGHDRLWKLPLVGASTVHLGGSINNLRY